MIDLILGDCMPYLDALEDAAFDLAVVDPPYGIGVTAMMTGTSLDKERRHGYKAHKKKEWDSAIPRPEYFTALRRVSKNQIIWGGNYFTDNLPPSRCWIVWDKDCKFSCVNPEMAWTSFNRPIQVFRRAHGLDKGFLNVEGGHVHPTQKPVALYDYVLRTFAEKGARILDTHLGGGSIALACHRLGLDLVGIEIDPDYYAAACKRLKDERSQLRMALND